MWVIFKYIMNIRQILKDNNFRFNHSLGQNFITDDNLLKDIVTKSGITSEDIVVEIGTGAGTLTRELAMVAKKVVSFELDKNLIQILNITLQGLDNVEVVFKDVLKLNDEELAEIIGGKFKVVANLPYYITTPLIMRFLESSLDLESITIMIQQEVANRLVAKSNTADYGVITVAVELYGNANIVLNVPKTYFYPMPKVDSAVVKIDVNRTKYDDINRKELMKLVKCGFAMRRKVLTNNLKSTYNMDRETAEGILTSVGLDIKVRGEALSIDDYIKLLDAIKIYECKN